jgi:hypothetical protein
VRVGGLGRTKDREGICMVLVFCLRGERVEVTVGETYTWGQFIPHRHCLVLWSAMACLCHLAVVLLVHYVSIIPFSFHAWMCGGDYESSCPLRYQARHRSPLYLYIYISPDHPNLSSNQQTQSCHSPHPVTNTRNFRPLPKTTIIHLSRNRPNAFLISTS